MQKVQKVKTKRYRAGPSNMVARRKSTLLQTRVFGQRNHASRVSCGAVLDAKNLELGSS